MTTIENFWEQMKSNKYQLRKAIVKPTYLIANEGISVKSGQLYKIKVKKVSVPENRTIYLSPYHVSDLGSVLSVGESMPKPIDLRRSIDHVLFISIKSGKIQKGDTLGHLMLIPLKIKDE